MQEHLMLSVLQLFLFFNKIFIKPKTKAAILRFVHDRFGSVRGCNT